jgi:hypothetical protein
MQALLHQQLHHHQRGIDRIVESGFRLLAGLLDETDRKKFLKQSQNPCNGGFSRLRGTFGRAAAQFFVRKLV